MVVADHGILGYTSNIYYVERIMNDTHIGMYERHQKFGWKVQGGGGGKTPEPQHVTYVHMCAYVHICA